MVLQNTPSEHSQHNIFRVTCFSTHQHKILIICIKNIFIQYNKNIELIYGSILIDIFVTNTENCKYSFVILVLFSLKLFVYFLMGGCMLLWGGWGFYVYPKKVYPTK